MSVAVSTLYLHWDMYFCTIHVFNTYPTRTCKYGEGFVMCLPSMIAIYKYVKGFQAKGCVLHRKKTWQKTRFEKKMDEIGDRLDTSARKTLVQLAQQMACLHHPHELWQNCCIDIHVR